MLNDQNPKPTEYIVNLGKKDETPLTKNITALSPEDALREALADPDMGRQFDSIPFFQAVYVADPAWDLGNSLVPMSPVARLARRIIETIKQNPEPLTYRDVVSAVHGIKGRMENIRNDTPINQIF